MSIAITAPEKFDFQDIACVALILRHTNTPGASFLVEPNDGEDGKLKFERDGMQVVAEVQVKGASGAVTLAKVATCLAHTPADTENNTLLERLIANSNSFAVLVMSGRCDDATSPFTVTMDWAVLNNNQSKISVKDAQALINAFATADVPPDDPDSSLKQARIAHNAVLARSLNPRLIRVVLTRVVILERYDNAQFEAFCAQCLQRDHRIPGDRLEDVILKCRQAVKRAKSDHVDAVPLIREILEHEAPQSIRPRDYEDRGEELDLVDELSNVGLLLLSGRSRVGKTWTALRVASEFETKGYKVKNFKDDVDQAKRFLNEPSQAARLALLDDPLGGIHSAPEPVRTLSRLKTLSRHLDRHRKLIVTQNTDRLLSVANAYALEDVNIDDNQWHNLNSLRPEFLVRLWLAESKRHGVPSSLCDTVQGVLQNGAVVFEPGCLLHLAVNHERITSPENLEQIERVARQDANDLGHALSEERSEPLLAALAITTTPKESIDDITLAYVAGAGGLGLPGKSKSLGKIINFGRPLPSASKHPTYDVPPVLTEEQSDWLDTLEKKRFLNVEKQRYTFAHSFYRAAAESLLNAPTSRKAKRTTTTVQRGLLCLSPQTSRATARNLNWVFDVLQHHQNSRDTLLDIAENGLESIFPATRDLCFRFLLHHFDEMSTERQLKLSKWITQVTSIKLDDLEWIDGQAYLPWNNFYNIDDDYLDSFLERISLKDIASELKLLDDSDGPFVSAEYAARTLKYLAYNSGELTASAMVRLLNYDEAAIRAEAIRIWLSTARSDDDLVLARLFADNHPSCAFAALKGAMAGWHDCNTARQNAVLKGLVTLAENPVCAIAMIDHLVLFNRVEETGDKPPWPIFGTVIPIIMDALPYNAFRNDARFFAVVRSAVEALPSTSIVSLCDKWINWLDRNATEGRLPSEFLLGVAKILITATKEEPTLRIDRVDRLLAFTSTGALIAFVADLVDGWEHLTEDERTAILIRLQSGHTDDLWLQAAALTRTSPPEDIEAAILDEIRLNHGPDVLLDCMNPELLIACVHVYTGRPQPLWWIGTHLSGKTIWEPVLEVIARTPGHQLFDLAWDHIAYDGDGARVANIIQDVGSAEAERMLDILIRLKVHCTGDFMPEAWTALLALAPDDASYNAWIDRIAAPVGAILDDLSDIKRWLLEDRGIKAMIKRLNNDLELCKIAKNLHNTPNTMNTSDTWTTTSQTIELMIKQFPPRLFGTCDRLLNVLKDLTVDVLSLRQVLETRKTEILAECEQTKAELERSDPPLRAWLSTQQTLSPPQKVCGLMR
ncbi:MAG: hypothetical protein HQM03_18245 [Magnetococcales bacterium]|nr:hypothetical protein [Magnetococcales bacterium]